MQIKSYAARLAYRQSYIRYKHQKPSDANLGFDVDLPMRAFDGDEVPVVLRFAKSDDPLVSVFREIDGRFFMPLRISRRKGEELVPDFAREDDLPSLLGLAKIESSDSPILRPGLRNNDYSGLLGTIEQMKAAEANKGEPSRYGGNDIQASIDHARVNAEALVLIDGVVHQRTPEPVWVVDKNSITAVLGRDLDNDKNWYFGDVRHVGFPRKGDQHREAFVKRIDSDASTTKQLFAADRLDDALAFAQAFGEPVVQGSIEMVGDAELHLPAFVNYAHRMAQRLEQSLTADDFRVLNRQRFMIYADLRDALGNIKKHDDRSYLYGFVDALAALSDGISLPEDGKYRSWGKWIQPAKAMVARWKAESARSDFELYPEEAVQSAIPDLAPAGPAP